MLTNVPAAVNRMARNVIVNHPNTFNCQVFRKRVIRSGALVGGLPTLGGLGVIDSDDEDEIVFDHLGNGYALQAEGFAPSPMMDRQDANNGSANEFRFMIEPEQAEGVTGHFSLKTHDVFLIIITDTPLITIKIAYEIVGVETTVNIPPYVMRYVANRRGDLDLTP